MEALSGRIWSMLAVPISSHVEKTPPHDTRCVGGTTPLTPESFLSGVFVADMVDFPAEGS